MQPEQKDAAMMRWSLHAKSAGFRRRLESAIAVIARASEHRLAISWSGGKDSTATAHLVRSVVPDAPILVQFDDCDWPQKRPYISRVASALGWEYQAVEAPGSVWEAAKLAGLGSENIWAKSHKITREFFVKPLHSAQTACGAVGAYLGLRKSESRSRRIDRATHGPLWRRRDGSWRCCPIIDWTAADAFAYLVKHGIEINPLYFQNRFRSPEDIRISWALPTPTGLLGDMQHIRWYWPQQYARLSELGLPS